MKLPGWATRFFTRSSVPLNLDPHFWQPVRVRNLTAGGDLRLPFHEHPWTYAAIHRIAETISQVPFQVRRFTSQSPDDQGTPLPEDDPFQRVLLRPNRNLHEGQLIYAISCCLDLYGECLLWFSNSASGEYDPRRGAPLVIFPVLRPLEWKPIIDGDLIVGWKDREQNLYSAGQVLQIKYWNPENMHRGLSRLTPLAATLQTDHKAGRFNLSFIENGADPGGVLVSDLPLTTEQSQTIRAQWESRHQGALRARRIAVLGGGLRYEPIKVSHNDMQFLDGRRWNREEILAVLGVPKQEVGLIDDVNRATAQVTARMWWQNNLIPRMQLIRRAFQAFMLEPARGGENLALVFDTSGVEALQEGMLERIQQAEGLVKLGYPLNAVNARLNLGMDDVEGGDVPLVAGNLVPLVLVASQEELPSLTPPAPGSEDEEDPDEEEPEDEEDADDEDEEEDDEEDRAAPTIPARKFPVTKLLRTPEGRHAYIEQLDKALYHPAERQLQLALRRYYRRVKKATLERLDEWAALHGLKSGSATKIVPLSAQQVTAFLLSVRELASMMSEEARPQLDQVAIRAVGTLASEIGGFTVVQPNLDTPFIRQLVGRRLASMVRLSAADREIVREALLGRIAEGGFSDIRELQTAVRRAFDSMSNVRALRIARTESGILANGVRFDAMRQEGITKHEWVSAGDDVVRPEDGDAAPGQGNHRVVDGQVIEIGSAFLNGLRYPHDVGGPAAEVVNCRCRAAPVA